MLRAIIHDVRMYVIKTHHSESRGQEEAAVRELFTGSIAQKFADAVTKPP